MRFGEQLTFWPTMLAANAAACGQPISIPAGQVLAAIQTTQAPILPVEGMANAQPFGQEGSPLVFEFKEASINATCAPQVASIYASAAGPRASEPQSDLFDMSQGGA